MSKQWLQKLSQFKKLQKTTSLNYTILKTLYQSLQQQPLLAKTDTFQSLLKSLPSEIHQLCLYSQLIYQIWKEETYPIETRQTCCSQILTIVTQWIMYFELQSPNADSMENKFALLKNFIIKHSRNIETTLLIINQIFEDLRDFFDQQFWTLPLNGYETQKKNKHQNKRQNLNEHKDEAKQIIGVLELIVFRQIQIIEKKDQNNQNIGIESFVSTTKYFSTDNYYEFVLRCINYLLSLDLDLSQQSQATKIALQFTKSLLCLQNHTTIISLFKSLMVNTQKSVRLALVEEYIQVYEFFRSFQCYQVIQELEDMVYFRQLIIGHSKATHKTAYALEQHIPQKYFSYLNVKAGSKQKIYFSLQDSTSAILKLQMHLQQGMDINLRFYHFTTGNKQILYHQVLRTDLMKLDLKINFSGLYAIEFDNSYSWIQAKNIKYHLHLMKLTHLQNITK